MNDLNVKISFILTQAAPKEIPITEAKKTEHNEINIDSDSDSSSIETTLDDASEQDSSPIQCVESTPDEKLMREYIDQAYAYYNDRTSIKPSQHAILFPAQQICITYNKQPVVANLATFLQESERRAIRKEYIEQFMGILPSCLPRIDIYALGRVLKRTKPYRNTYSKIIHTQLNTVMVNQRWMQSDPICPFCKKSKETWIHVITCNAPVKKAIRDRCISDFDLMLSQHKTYPPLHEFFLKFLTNLNFSPHELDVVNSNYCYLFHRAYQAQNQTGWENFLRGFIAHDWKCLQYKYFLKLKSKDVHAVDKWARMVIKHLLELHRVMWKNRCDLIAQDNIQPYEGGHHQDLTSLCTYLQANSNELLEKDVHYLDRSLDFFSKTPLDNLLMWQRQILAFIARNDPEIVIRPATKENTIKRHFRTVQKKKKRGRPKKTKQNRRNARKITTRSPVGLHNSQKENKNNSKSTYPLF